MLNIKEFFLGESFTMWKDSETELDYLDFDQDRKSVV